VYVFDQIAEKNEQDQKHDLFATNQLFILKLKENRGYTGGNNAGITWMLKQEVDAVFICNNDTMVYTNTLSAMISAMNQSKDVGVSSCKIVGYDNKSVINPGGNLKYWLGVHFYWRFKDSRKGKVEVNFVPGCAMMIRSSLLKAIGGFREDFFLYVDDIEFCNRVLHSGWKIVINLNAQIRSRIGGGNGSAVYYYFITRNTLVFINEELKGVQRFAAFIAFCIERFIQMGFWIFTKKWCRIKGIMKGFRDYLQGVHGPGWARHHLAEHAESSP
jgi:GT2 family glycosyltransferase